MMSWCPRCGEHVSTVIVPLSSGPHAGQRRCPACSLNLGWASRREVDEKFPPIAEKAKIVEQELRRSTRDTIIELGAYWRNRCNLTAAGMFVLGLFVGIGLCALARGLFR